MSVTVEAARVIRELAADLKACNTNADGVWDDPEDENEYSYLLGLAQRLDRHIAIENVTG